ncbi:MAG: ankyrin repeat domain-containing protein, partial [Betaproteobacteria bacterium]
MQPTCPSHNTFPDVPDFGIDLFPTPAAVLNVEVSPERTQAPPPDTTTGSHPLAADQKLHRIIRFGNKYDLSKLIDEAISEGAQLNHPECYECNSLVVAVRANNSQAISPLLVRGAQLPVLDDNNIDLLMEACRSGDVNMAIELVKVAKMNVNAQDATGKTALHYAVIGGSQELTLLILSSGANPNAEA